MSSSMALRRSPKPGALTAATFSDAAEGVHHEGGEGFTVDVFSDDHERTAGLGNLLENRQKLTDVADLLVVNQDVGVLEETQPACPDC